MGRRLLLMDQFSEMWWITDCKTLSLAVSSAISLNNQADGFNLFFALAVSVISRVGSAKGISN